MRLKENALSIFMQDQEILDSMMGDDSYNKEQTLEKVNFLKDFSGKEIFVKSYTDTSVRIAKYENGKSYSFPIDILELEEEEEENEKIEKIEEKKIFTIETIKKYFSYVIFAIMIVLLILSNMQNEKVKAEKEKSEIILLKEDVASLDFKIGSEYEIQKHARETINKSIEKVKQMDQEKKEIEKRLLIIINPK